MPSDCKVQVFAPAGPEESWEIHEPLWIEYVKLVVYAFLA